MERTQVIVDTTAKLWDYLYRVRMPYQQSRHIEDIRKHGTVISGVPEIDRDLHNEWCTTMLSVAQMTEYYKVGVPLRIASEKDVKEIYENISAHIHAWKTRLERGINIGDAPVDDLVVLDKFANTIFDQAKYQFTPDTAQSIIANRLTEIQKVNANTFFKNTAYLKTGDKNEDGVTRINAEEELPERDSLGDFFKSRLIHLKRR